LEHEIRKTNIWVSAQELVFGQKSFKTRGHYVMFFAKFTVAC